MYPSTVYHVAPERGHWTLREERDAATVTTCAEKESALRLGRELARSRHGALVIHREDGSIVAEHRY